MPDPSPNAIEVTNLVKMFAGVAAVNDISFTLARGEILGFLGPNGAGKSTTMRILTGYLPATSGHVRICGIPVTTQPDEIKRRIGYMPENNPLPEDMRVSEYLYFRGRLKEVPRRKLGPRIDEVLELCDLKRVRHRIIGRLSKGYRQRVGIAETVLAEPPVIIMDEPTIGLDPHQILIVRDLIGSLRGRMAVIISSHILPEIEVTCDRVMIINQGRVVAEGTPAALRREIDKLSAAGGKVDMMRMPVDYPHVVASSGRTWGATVDARLHDPKLKAIVSSLWGYYGLPPSKLSSFYYALPTISYLTEGGYYPKGRSQDISNAFVRLIEKRGGKVLLNSRVEKILTKDGAAYGVRTAAGQEYQARAVISNASAYNTFHKLLDPDERLAPYLARLDGFSVSLSSFIVFLGLKQDLVRQLGLKDTEIFYDPGYDPEATYRGALSCDMTSPGFGVTLYDNLFPGYSPAGKNTITVMTLQGFDHWKPFEAAYAKGDKAAYRQEKERMADLLIRQAERVLLPGLTSAIEVKEIATPLTNARYTGNYRGAIYGWDQTLDNSNPHRLGHTTPVGNLYLSGAWTSPGGGYGGVLASGLQCFSEIMTKWG